MDNGALQKEKVVEFEQIVSHTKWKKGKQNLQHTTRRSSQDRTILIDQVLMSRETPTTSASNSTNSQLTQPCRFIREDKSNDELPEPERTTYLEQI